MYQINLQKSFQYFWLILFILSAIGCGGETDPVVPGGTKIKTTIAPGPKPINVRVVVPYAGNMPGFMNHKARKGANQTEFQSRVLKLLTQVNQPNKEVANKQFFLVESDKGNNPSSFKELYHLIDGTKPKSYSKSVDVPKLFRDATEMKEFDKYVTVIVTDLVHNGSVKTDLSAIKTLMTDALAKAAPKVAVSLYEETSKFDGAFYPAMR